MLSNKIVAVIGGQFGTFEYDQCQRRFAQNRRFLDFN